MVFQYLRTRGKSLLTASVHQHASSILSNIGTWDFIMEVSPKYMKMIWIKTFTNMHCSIKFSFSYHADVSQGILVSAKVGSASSLQLLHAIVSSITIVIMIANHQYYLGDLFKVMVNGLPSYRCHIVKQGHFLKGFCPQNLEQNVHEDESLQNA